MKREFCINGDPQAAQCCIPGDCPKRLFDTLVDMECSVRTGKCFGTFRLDSPARPPQHQTDSAKSLG
jgi:hypothetical protein